MPVLEVSAINGLSTITKGRQSNGNRQYHILEHIKKNSGKCDREQISNELFTQEFGKGPWEEKETENLVARMTIYKKAVKVALGTNKASINKNDDLSHTVSESDKGLLIAKERVGVEA